MKKLFLTSGLVLGALCSAFAGDDITPGGTLSSDNTEAASCVYGVLDSYESAVSFEAKWSPKISGAITLNSDYYSTSSASNPTYTSSTTPAVSPATQTPLYSVYGVNLYATQVTTSTYESATPVTTLNPVPSLQGYTFAGFYTNKAKTGTQVINGSGTVLEAGKTEISSSGGTAIWYAGYDANTYNISYDLNYANAGTWTNDTTHPTSATYDTVFNVVNPNRTGWTFNGWNISGMDTTTHYRGTTSTPATSFSTATASNITDTYFKNLRATSGTATFTAQWNANQYDVTYAAGTCSGTGRTITNGLTYDSNYTVLGLGDATTYSGVTEPTGYTFQGWTESLSGNAVRAAGYVYTPWQVEGGLTLTASCTANSHTVTYSCGVVPAGATTGTPGSNIGGTAPTAAASPVYNSSYSLATTQGNCAGLNGYHFGGWKCNYNMSDGQSYTGTTANYASSLVNSVWTVSASVSQYKVDADMTCTAVWVPNVIQLSWNPNNGTGPNGTTYEAESETRSCQYDGDIILPTPPERIGYTFEGWQVAQASSFRYQSLLSNASVNGSQNYSIAYRSDADYCKAQGASLNGNTGDTSTFCSNSAFNGMNRYEWVVEFNYGTLHGLSTCSGKSGNNNNFAYDNDSSNWRATIPEITAAGSGSYCWCRATGFKPNNSNSVISDDSAWYYAYNASSNNNCEASCAADCAGGFMTMSSVRSAAYQGE